MKSFAKWFAVVAVLLAARPAAAERGGTWPFFCFMGDATNTIDSFRLVDDEHSPTGYGIHLYSDGEHLGYVIANVSDSDDGTQLVVYASQRVGLARERQVFVKLTKDQPDASVGDALMTFGRIPRTFDMQQLTCRAD